MKSDMNVLRTGNKTEKKLTKSWVTKSACFAGFIFCNLDEINGNSVYFSNYRLTGYRSMCYTTINRTFYSGSWKVSRISCDTIIPPDFAPTSLLDFHVNNLSIV